MTQKEKLGEARMLAAMVKSTAIALRYDAKDYDVKFPISYADDLERMADKFLKLK